MKPDGAAKRLKVDGALFTGEQCIAGGLKPGQTIVGREQDDGSRNWHEARLTLLWAGKEIAVFSEQERTNFQPEWTSPRETADWTLEFRSWYFLRPTPPQPPQ